MKNVLVISSSLRTKSNSEAMAQEFAKGAAEAGNKVEVVSLRGTSISGNTLKRTCTLPRTLYYTPCPNPFA